ncbi:MAG: AlbA family DNA-binding domain-containing protein [Anaerolineae bacterium]
MEREPRLQKSDLAHMCEEREQEGLRLEFKSCNELKIGSAFYDRDTRTTRARTREDVTGELSRDVSSFLNSDGGRIVYGIRERDSRALELDSDNAFRTGDAPPPVNQERVMNWVTSHIRPTPAVDVYTVAEDGDSWYIVIDIPQGEQAYQASDKVFYKRVAARRQAMEQYEIVDAMSRTKGAALEAVPSIGRVDKGAGHTTIHLDIAVTSHNHIASEQGVLRAMTVGSLSFADNPYSGNIPVTVGASGAFVLPTGDALSVKVSWLRYRWGAFTPAGLVFPGDSLPIQARLQPPGPRLDDSGNCLLSIELFTLNRAKATSYYVLSWGAGEGAPTLASWNDLSPERREAVLASLS